MPEDLQQRTQQIGREIFARIREANSPSPLVRFDEAMMALSMRAESLKSQLFRFVDVLPVLGSSQAVAGHLSEYLGEAARQAPRLSWAARLTPSGGPLGAIVSSAAMFNVRRMAQKFIAAGDLEGAVAAIAKLRERRLGFTLDVLGEAVVSEAEAERYQEQYLELLRSLPSRVATLKSDPLIDQDTNRPVPRTNVSVKLSSLFSQFDPLDSDGSFKSVLARLRPILRLARESGVFINFDMEQSYFREITLELFKSVLMEPEFRDWADVGIAIQAYLRCTPGNLERLAEWSAARRTPVTVRLVKGAYWDYETIIAAQNDWPVPVFTDKAATDANFEQCANYLIRHRKTLRPAIASHNVRSIADALAFAEAEGAEQGDLEFQMLYGMAEPIKEALVSMGQRVRVYTPFGKLLPGMAYLVRRLLENTSNESFLRAGFHEHAPEEQLLMNPILKIKPVHSSNGSAKAEYRNESPTDFSLHPERKKMAAAVDAVLRSGVRDDLLVIGGKRFASGKWIESVNPSHKSRIVGRSASATVEHAEQAIAAAKSAFANWRDVDPNERANLLDRVGKVLGRNRFELAAIEVAECGKPWREADADIAEAIDFCHYYAWQMRELSRAQGKNVPGERNDWTYEPRGVAVIIAPWNFPLAILCGMAAAAVVTGNTAILKPAEQSPLIAARLMAAFEEAGAPPGVVNYLPGVGEEIGPTLVEHPDVALLAFTGSRAVGLSINATAAKTDPAQDHVKRVIVEMGGKNAVIVDEDADLDDAITGVVQSAFGYSGQKCSACSRVIVVDGIYETFLDRLIEATRSLQIAPAEDPACRVGPVIDAEAFDRINKAIEQGKTEVRLAFAGDVGSLAGEGFFIAPHIFADVPASSALAQEEIFGPVLSVMRAANLDQALTLANGVKYALTGGIYSRSPKNISRARRDFRVGNLYINRRITGALVGRQPFGGMKLSGGGTQAGGPDYLRHFMMPRCITENTIRHGFAADET
jgi:RHH-type transcriptional regulator, proline utilization regulon repressor / proline dehydrogenase / delta 1-pyrroline-5-carboxylate dehydrogenase